MNPDNSHLLEAFQITHYWVDELDLNILIGQTHPLLDDRLKELSYTCWSFITAYNPAAELLTTQENSNRQCQLQQKIKTIGLTYSTGRAIDPTNRWPDEESLLIYGLSSSKALIIASQFGQLAFVYGKIGGVATLKWV